jgi:hypothetical protein
MDNYVNGKRYYVSTVSHGAVQANAASNFMPKRKPVHKKTKCINCGKAGHMYSDCEEPMSTCGKCSGTHHTSMHDQVQSLRRNREERLARLKQNQKEPTKPSPKDKINQMVLNVHAQDNTMRVDTDDVEAMQFEALVAVEEAMKSEVETYPTFVDEDSYVTGIVIGGVELKAKNASTFFTRLDETAELVTEEEVDYAMKALKTLDDDDDYDDGRVIFDTGCTAHIL